MRTQVQIDEEEALAGEIKALATACGVLADKLYASRIGDQRWVAIGTTDLQKGFMEWERSITKPALF